MTSHAQLSPRGAGLRRHARTIIVGVMDPRRATSELTLSLLAEPYAVCRMPAGAALPAAPPDADLWIGIVARGEATLVCPEEDMPRGARVEEGWRAFKIEQVFDFSVPGILASVLQPLAAAGIGIFATSTFSTDYVLVKARDLERAVGALRAAGHRVIR